VNDILDHDWWTLPLEQFDNMHVNALQTTTITTTPAPTSMKKTHTQEPTDDHPNRSMFDRDHLQTLTSFDAMKINTHPDMKGNDQSMLLELEKDLVGHNGQLISKKVQLYEQSQQGTFTPPVNDTPTNSAPTTVVDGESVRRMKLNAMKREYELQEQEQELWKTSSRSMRLYYGGELDRNPEVRGDLIPETAVVWMGRNGPRGTSRGGNSDTSNRTTFHLLQQWWNVPTYVSAGLATAPEKPLEELVQLVALKSGSGGNDIGGVAQGATSNELNPGGDETTNEEKKTNSITNPANNRVNKRGSMFSVLDTVFGLNKPQKTDALEQVRQRRQSIQRSAKNIDVSERLHPEQPLEPKSVRLYQQYVALGRNPWHNHGCKAERQLHQEDQDGLHGVHGDKRALEMFRHVSYLQAEPDDLAGMRDVQNAGGATKIISHGMYRGLSQDDVAVDDKSILDQFLWQWSSSEADVKTFESLGGGNGDGYGGDAARGSALFVSGRLDRRGGGSGGASEGKASVAR
jgi:hypothetical protein